MTIFDFIDVDNIEHIKALDNLSKTGKFPEGFLPKEVEASVPPPSWYWRLYGKLAQRWIQHKLSEHANMQPAPSGNIEADSSSVESNGLIT